MQEELQDVHDSNRVHHPVSDGATVQQVLLCRS